MLEFFPLHLFAFEPAQPLGSRCIWNGCTFKVLPTRIDQPYSRLLPKLCAEPESVLAMVNAGSFIRRSRKDQLRLRACPFLMCERGCFQTDRVVEMCKKTVAPASKAAPEAKSVEPRKSRRVIEFSIGSGKSSETCSYK